MYQEHGITVTILGMGDSRLQRWGHGFGVKLDLVQNHLEQLTKHNKNPLIVFTDAFDVLLVANIGSLHADLRERYNKMQSTVVFSAEKNCAPDKDREHEYPLISSLVSSPYKFLNSGTYMGPAKSILELIHSLPYNIQTDDQRYWTTLYLKHVNKLDNDGRLIMSLDTNASIFMCMHASEYDVTPVLPPSIKGENISNTSRFKRQRCIFYNNITKTYPLYLHFNGNKRPLNWFYKQWKQ